MPAANPFIDNSIPGNTGSVGNLSLTTAQYAAAGTAAVADAMYTSPISQNQVNAAGTSENVAMHVAIIIVLALVGLFIFRKSGFRFAVAAGVGS